MREPTYLDLALAARAKAQARIDHIARETSPVIVEDIYYANPYDASTVKGRIVESCMAHIERLDAVIARLQTEDDEYEIRYGAISPNGCRDCGADTPNDYLCDACMPAHKANAAAMAREVA